MLSLISESDSQKTSFLREIEHRHWKRQSLKDHCSTRDIKLTIHNRIEIRDGGYVEGIWHLEIAVEISK